MTNLPWAGAPALLQEYLVPGAGRGRFPFFPCVAYIAFGQAIGAVVKRAAAERFDRLMQWSMLIGFSMIFIGAVLLQHSLFHLYEGELLDRQPGPDRHPRGNLPDDHGRRVPVDRILRGQGWSWMQAMGQELPDGLLGSRHDRVRSADTAHQAYALHPAGGAGSGDRHRDDGSDVGAVALLEGKESGARKRDRRSPFVVCQLAEVRLPSRREFPITERLESTIAAAARMGFNTPATASVMPTTL